MRSLALCVAISTVVAPLAAQDVARPDSLLASGNLVAAESAYYSAAHARPRDPQARRQLGRYLAQRGALRVGAVLLEEARSFGGDPATIARDLVPLYRALGDWRALSTLPASPLGAGERAQAVWLVEHPPALEATDSAIVSYRPPTPSDGSTLGHVVIKVDGRAIEARIDPTRRGVLIDPRAAAVAHVHRFAARADGSVPAAVDSLQIGAVKLMNVPIALEPLPERVDAIIGIDVLQRFAPSFDPREQRLTLRVSGSVPPTTPGVRVPALTSASDVRVLQAGQVVSISVPTFATLLRTKRWTFDAKRGSIIIDG